MIGACNLICDQFTAASGRCRLLLRLRDRQRSRRRAVGLQEPDVRRVPFYFEPVYFRFSLSHPGLTSVMHPHAGPPCSGRCCLPCCADRLTFWARWGQFPLNAFPISGTPATRESPRRCRDPRRRTAADTWTCRLTRGSSHRGVRNRILTVTRRSRIHRF